MRLLVSDLTDQLFAKRRRNAPPTAKPQTQKAPRRTLVAMFAGKAREVPTARQLSHVNCHLIR